MFVACHFYEQIRNIVGLVQPIRFALALAGVSDHTDVRIEPGLPMDNDYKQAWFSAKQDFIENVNCPQVFPNLPYYMDDCVQLTQSDTILRYIGRKYNLMGVPGQEHVVDLVLDELKDFEGQLTGYSYGAGDNAVAAFMESSVCNKLKQFNKFLKNHDYLTGDKISIADVKLFTFILKLEVIQNKLQTIDFMNDNTDLESFATRMKSLPSIRSYMESPHYQKVPLNNPHAKSPFN